MTGWLGGRNAESASLLLLVGCLLWALRPAMATMADWSGARPAGGPSDGGTGSGGGRRIQAIACLIGTVRARPGPSRPEAGRGRPSPEGNAPR
jgi:hypothetical protein